MKRMNFHPGLVSALAAAICLASTAPAAMADDAAAGAGLTGEGASQAENMEACILASANLYHLPPLVLVILLHVEGGRPGQVHGNANGTVDIGPMQINQAWLPQLAMHWHATPAETYGALAGSFCANVEAGSWILRQSIDEAGGRLWLGVAYYHSHSAVYETQYLHEVLIEAEHLETMTGNAVR